MTKSTNMFTGAPKVIKIGAMDYKVVPLEKIEDEDGTQSWGEIEYNTYTIRVQKVQPSIAGAVDTLLHELLHGIWHETDLRGDIGVKLEERIVRNLSSGLIALFRDNPQFLRWMERKLAGK